MAELKTGVDQLMELVQQKQKMSVADAAKELGVPEDTLQSWVDFLVDEHVLGIEYKFTTPYIYVHSEERLQEAQQEKNYTLKDFKDVFIAYAQEKGMPEGHVPQLWKNHIQHALEQEKPYFMEQAQRAQIEDAEKLFSEFVEVTMRGA